MSDIARWSSTLRLVIVPDVGPLWGADNKRPLWTKRHAWDIMERAREGASPETFFTVLMGYPGYTHDQVTAPGSEFNEAWTRWARDRFVTLVVHSYQSLSRVSVHLLNAGTHNDISIHALDQAFFGHGHDWADVLGVQSELDRLTSDVPNDAPLEEQFERGLFVRKGLRAPDEVVVVTHGESGEVSSHKFELPE